MQDGLIWYIVVEMLGFLALPLVALALPHLPDRGWSLAKPLVILLIGLVCWLPLMLFPALPYSRGWIVLVVLLFAAANAMLVVRRPSIGLGWLRFVRRQWLYVVASEALFGGAMWVMASLRALNPAPEGTEKFMDLAFLSSIMRAQHLPPPDPWLTGYPINYYYFGHFLLATLAKLLNTAPQIAFNVGIALIAGLVAITVFGVATNLTAVVLGSRRKQDPAATEAPPLAERAAARLAHAAPFALFSVALVLILGNLRSFFNWWGAMNGAATATHRTTLSVAWAWLTHPNTWANYDYWWPTRAIPHTITEFPDFSFLLADLHAHVLALPYTVLAIGLALHLWLSPPRRGPAAFGEGGLALILTGLSIGALYLMNGWDLPTYLLLALLAVALHQWNAHGRQFSGVFAANLGTIVAVVLACCFIPYLPFYLTFISPSQGLAFVPGAPDHLAVLYNFANPDTVPAADIGTRTAITDELGMNGLAAFILGSWLVVLLVQRLQTYFMRAAPPPGPLPIGDGEGETTGEGIDVGATLMTPVASGSAGMLPVSNPTPRPPPQRNLRGGEAPTSWHGGEIPSMQGAEIGLDGTVAWHMQASAVAVPLTRTESWARAWGLVGIIAVGLVGVTAMVPLWAGWTFVWAVLFGALALWLTVQPFARRQSASAEEMATSFPLLMASMAFGLIALCEVVFLRDVFVGWGPRMNTIFKFYYQVWMLFALASAPALAWMVLRVRERLPIPNAAAWQPMAYLWRGLWGLGLVALVAMSLIYPLGASHAIYPIGQQATPTLDGLTQNTALDPGDIAAITWLQTHIVGSPTIIEGIDPNGSEYSSTIARISVFTGLPTVIGWPGHEDQWRVNWLKNPANTADYQARLRNLGTIYTSPDRATVLSLLHHYHVQLVIVGAVEQRLYGATTDLSHFHQYLAVLYDKDGVVIYQVPN